MAGTVKLKCPLCKSLDTYIIYENNKMPYGTSMKDETIDIKVSYCKNCSFVFQSSAYNNIYDQQIEKLYKNYKITNMYNFPNRSFHNIKAMEFISEFIDNRIDFNILEIGSNRGDFLYLLKEKFPQINVLGCEPTEFDELKVPTINSSFDPKLFSMKFDLIILRHTLEHIKFPKEFVQSLKSLVNPEGKIFIEVPNLINSLKNYIEDFTPDHVNFFTLKSLSEVFLPYKILKKDDEEFIYTIFSHNNKDQFLLKLDEKILSDFSQFNDNILAIKNNILKYDRIIFYGISNFYLWTYVKLEPLLKNKEKLFLDDHLNRDDLFGLPKANELQKNDLIILCSSNSSVINKMRQNLPKNIDILVLWKGIENV